MTSEQKYKRLGANYHWGWASAGDSNPYVRWVKRVLAVLPEAGQGATLLDVGCGDGYPASLLAARGYVVTGVDVLEEPLNVARERVPNAIFFNAEYDTPAVYHDYVLAFESLEHMEDPSLLVEAVKACGEYALISCPPPGLDPYAVRDYTRDELIALFEGCEVEVLIDEGEHRLFKVTPVESSTLPMIEPEEAAEPPQPKRTKKHARRRPE